MTEIRNDAFRGSSYCDYDDNWNYSCSGNLSELNFADGSMLTTIGDYAFTDQQLNSLDIPDSVTTIGLGAFKGNNLSSLVIGDSITSQVRRKASLQKFCCINTSYRRRSRRDHGMFGHVAA